MRITAPQPDLSALLQPAERAISTRSILPVLSGLRLEAKGGRLTAVGTDLEMTVVSQLPVKVHNQGTTIAPGKLLGDIIRSLSDSDVELKTENDGLTVRCRDAEFQLRTYSTGDFPETTLPPSRTDVKVAGLDLSQAIKQVARAVSRDETRPILGGILLTVSDSTCRVVATDSYRLALRDVSFSEKANELSIVIPARALEELSKLAAEDQVELTLTENQVFFRTGNTMLSSRLLEGQFPNYQQLLPDSHATEVKCNRDELVAALRRVALLTPSTAVIKMEFSQDRTGSVKLLAVSPETGSATETLAVDISGEDIEIAFNVQFLMDGLQALPEQDAVLRFVSAARPGIITAATPSESNFVYLIMPIRVS